MIGSVWQRSTDGDGKHPYVEFLKSDVDGACTGFRSLYEDGGTNSYL